MAANGVVSARSIGVGIVAVEFSMKGASFALGFSAIFLYNSVDAEIIHQKQMDLTTALKYYNIPTNLYMNKQPDRSNVNAKQYQIPKHLTKEKPNYYGHEVQKQQQQAFDGGKKHSQSKDSMNLIHQGILKTRNPNWDQDGEDEDEGEVEEAPSKSKISTRSFKDQQEFIKQEIRKRRPPSLDDDDGGDDEDDEEIEEAPSKYKTSPQSRKDQQEFINREIRKRRPPSNDDDDDDEDED